MVHSAYHVNAKFTFLKIIVMNVVMKCIQYKSEATYIDD